MVRFPPGRTWSRTHNLQRIDPASLVSAIRTGASTPHWPPSRIPNGPVFAFRAIVIPPALGHFTLASGSWFSPSPPERNRPATFPSCSPPHRISSASGSSHTCFFTFLTLAKIASGLLEDCSRWLHEPKHSCGFPTGATTIWTYGAIDRARISSRSKSLRPMVVWRIVIRPDL